MYQIVIVLTRVLIKQVVLYCDNTSIMCSGMYVEIQ